MLGAHLGSGQQTLVPLDHQFYLPPYPIQRQNILRAQFRWGQRGQHQEPLTQEKGLCAYRAASLAGAAFGAATGAITGLLVQT